MRPLILAAVLAACGDPDLLTVIPDEPDAGMETTDAGRTDKVPDSGTLPMQDAGNDPECVPESHMPVPCRAGGCYGAVLCVRDRLICVAPGCGEEPEPDDCELLDIVILVDRSASMTPFMQSVQAATSSLARGRGQRNLFLVDIPGLTGAAERPGPNRECYGTSSSFPLPPCLDPEAAADQFPVAHWGGLEYTWDALADLRHTAQWTPGAERHAYLFADEPGQGMYFNQATAVSRLAGAGIVVHASVGYPGDFSDVVAATGGSLHSLGSRVPDPCD